MKYRAFQQIINSFYKDELDDVSSSSENKIIEKGQIKIVPKILYDKFTSDLKVEFKIGNTKMYRIKDLTEFYTRMMKNENYKYGNKLEFYHKKEAFAQEYIELLDFILKYAEIIKYANSDTNYKYNGNLNNNCITLSNSGLDEIFEILNGKKVEFIKDYIEKEIEFLAENPNIQFKIEKINENEYKLIPNIDIYKPNFLLGKKFTYILHEDKLYRCDEKFKNSVIKLVELFRENYAQEIIFGEQQLSELFSVLMPKIENNINLEKIEEEKIKKYKPEKLATKVYLDVDERDYIVANVKFCYGEFEFNPLDEKKYNIARNVIEETKTLNIFRKTGFMFDVKNLRFILPDENKVYEFLLEDINYYMQKFEVLATDKFKNKEIKKTKIEKLGVKIENNLLEIDLSTLKIDKEELKNILDKYNLKKKYYKLKDGSFLDLEKNDELEFLNKLITGMNVSYDDIENGRIYLPAYRSLYLNQLLKNIKNTEIQKNEQYKELINNLDEENIKGNIDIPESLNSVLRYYQKIGYEWLKTIDEYKFGGILADDMGLGKTVQILAILLNYINKTKIEKRKTSMVVCPSSLTLNWRNEVNKFAPDINTLVIHGNLSERKKQVDSMDNYDLVITSYDLLKRDIELYENLNYKFRFIIADEAQYLKNSNTQNAKSIKKIEADTRFALTGTPIENSLAELWSIFDFVMPGYLFSYRKFRSIYEMPIVRDSNKEAMDKLKMLIEPFILRRNKKEVLTELPEKTVTILNNEMNEEQENIYLTYLAQAKQEVADAVDLNGYESSKMQILAALTRLRQICCHPSLFIDNYDGDSSKLEQCTEIIKDAVNSGHKILLFSGYTSMFPFIEKELKENKIKYFKLTGSTKVEDRIELVDEFNRNDEIKIFLISLKAGGTGLNLTGADMVIHYDPWWNASAENQATDRAYRIGQKNNVQVYKLITKNSIEEKIYDLQQKKADLIDNVLNTETTFISKLSKEEIMSLFE